MRPPLRITFNLLTLLSLLLAILFIAIWVRSFFRADIVSRRAAQLPGVDFIRRSSWDVSTLRGNLTYSKMTVASEPPTVRYWRWDTIPAFGWSRFYQLRGLTVETKQHALLPSISREAATQPMSAVERRIKVGLWMPTLACMVLPLLWAGLKVREAKRHSTGECPGCGYDLRATPHRCPECGLHRVPSAAAAKKAPATNEHEP